MPFSSYPPASCHPTGLPGETLRASNFPAKVGSLWNEVRIASLEELPRRAVDPGIDVVIVAVPQQAAQAVADLAVQAGVRALLNFAPVALTVPTGVALRQVDLAVAMESLSYALANG